MMINTSRRLSLHMSITTYKYKTWYTTCTESNYNKLYLYLQLLKYRDVSTTSSIYVKSTYKIIDKKNQGYILFDVLIRTQKEFFQNSQQ